MNKTKKFTIKILCFFFFISKTLAVSYAELLEEIKEYKVDRRYGIHTKPYKFLDMMIKYSRNQVVVDKISTKYDKSIKSGSIQLTRKDILHLENLLMWEKEDTELAATYLTKALNKTEYNHKCKLYLIFFIESLDDNI